MMTSSRIGVYSRLISKKCNKNSHFGYFGKTEQHFYSYVCENTSQSKRYEEVIISQVKSIARREDTILLHVNLYTSIINKG
jgi:hypothetical protein